LAKIPGSIILFKIPLFRGDLLIYPVQSEGACPCLRRLFTYFKPMVFQFNIGGYSGTSFDITLQGDALSCKRWEGHSDQDQEELLVGIIDNVAWQDFVAYLRSRNWKGHYANEGILDGTDWEVSFRQGRQVIKASGSNAYPPGFRKCLRLLNEAIGAPNYAVY
jgi:hypothetical protein